MRLLPVSLLCALFASVVIAEAPEKKAAANTKDATDEPVEEDVQPTVFNNIEVPPLPDINGETFNATIKDGYWFVKNHSYVSLEIVLWRRVPF